MKSRQDSEQDSGAVRFKDSGVSWCLQTKIEPRASSRYNNQWFVGGSLITSIFPSLPRMQGSGSGAESTPTAELKDSKHL